MAAEGKGPAPLWVQALVMAEAWGMHPEDVLDRTSEEWYKRWRWWSVAKANARES